MIRFGCHDADDIVDAVVKLGADAQQAGAILRVGDDSVAAQLATEDLNLGLEEPDLNIPPSGGGFIEEVQQDV